MKRYMETVIKDIARSKKSFVLNYPVDNTWGQEKMAPGFKTEILKLLNQYRCEFPDNRFEVAGFSIALGFLDRETIDPKYGEILKVKHLVASSCEEEFVQS